jgi:LmbE family N-acetylglucosaminyl deacetylase
MIYILSPHIDDAIYSLGGLITNGQDKITVINIYSYSNYTLSEKGDPDKVTCIRKQEELEVSAKTGMKVINLDMNDRNMRRIKGFGKDETAIAAIIESMVNKDGKLCIPFGLRESHEDHIKARCIGELVSMHIGIPVIYYEDLPYVTYLTHPEEYESDLIATEYGIDIDKKLAFCAMYKSQCDGNMLNLIRAYAYDKKHNCYTERVWRKD